MQRIKGFGQDALHKSTFTLHYITSDWNLPTPLATIWCPSLCLSVHLYFRLILCRSRGVRRVCCCGPSGQPISIDCCMALLQQARSPSDPYPQQHGGQQQMRAVSCLRRRRKLNTYLFSLLSCSLLHTTIVIIMIHM